MCSRKLPSDTWISVLKIADLYAHISFGGTATLVTIHNTKSSTEAVDDAVDEVPM